MQAAEALAEAPAQKRAYLYLNDYGSYGLDLDYNVGKMIKTKLEEQINLNRKPGEALTKVYPKTLSYTTEPSKLFCKDNIMLLTPLKWLQFQDEIKECELVPLLIAEYYNQKEPYYSASIVIHQDSDLWKNQLKKKYIKFDKNGK